MDETEKETKTYRFEKQVIQHAEENPMISSFAQWACDSYKKEFMEIEILSKKMDDYFKMANVCKDRIKNLKSSETQGNKGIEFNDREILWLKKEAPERIKRATFEGVYKAFVNTFDRHDVKRKQFRLLINKFSGKKCPV